MYVNIFIKYTEYGLDLFFTYMGYYEYSLDAPFSFDNVSQRSCVLIHADLCVPFNNYVVFYSMDIMYLFNWSPIESYLDFLQFIKMIQ